MRKPLILIENVRIPVNQCALCMRVFMKHEITVDDSPCGEICLRCAEDLLEREKEKYNYLEANLMVLGDGIAKLQDVLDKIEQI